jgi:hypothetical protein
VKEIGLSEEEEEDDVAAAVVLRLRATSQLSGTRKTNV